MILVPISHIGKYGKFPKNISTSDGNINIVESAYSTALREHFFPVFGKELIYDCDDKVPLLYPYDSTVTRAVGEYVEYRSDVYEVLSASSAIPVGSSDYKLSELMTFYHNFLAPAFGLCVYYLYAMDLNMNLSKDHLQSIVSETSTIVNSADKGDMLARIRSRWVSAMNTAIGVHCRNNGVYDGKSYQVNRTRVKPLIRAIKWQ